MLHAVGLLFRRHREEGFKYVDWQVEELYERGFAVYSHEEEIAARMTCGMCSVNL